MHKRASSENMAVSQPKYDDSSFIVRYANSRFFKTIEMFVSSISPSKILDIGCGEGKLFLNSSTPIIPPYPVAIPTQLPR